MQIRNILFRVYVFAEKRATRQDRQVQLKGDGRCLKQGYYTQLVCHPTALPHDWTQQFLPRQAQMKSASTVHIQFCKFLECQPFSVTSNVTRIKFSTICKVGQFKLSRCLVVSKWGQTCSPPTVMLGSIPDIMWLLPTPQ